MSKSESSEMGRPRRPAARRAPVPANAGPETEVEPDSEASQSLAQPTKRIHARRAKLDSEPPAEGRADARAPRPAAARARASAPSQPPAPAPAIASEDGAGPAEQVLERERDSAVALEPIAEGELERMDEALESDPEGRRAAAEPDGELAGWTAPSRLHSDAAAADSYDEAERNSLALRRRASDDEPRRRSAAALGDEPRRRSAAALGSALRLRNDAVDDFGLDSMYEAKLRPFFEGICRNYLQVQVYGAQHIPAHGRVLLVSNHSRALSWDGIVLRTALRQNHDSHRELRWLVEDEQFHAPFLGTFVNRLGAVRACQDNAERLLARDELVAVFPEGVKVADKRYQDRYKLLRFGRGGYVKLALRTGTPVIPVAIVGLDEPSPLLAKSRALSRWLGRPLFALSPVLPRLGALGVPPLPSRWRISIGEPVREISRQDAEAVRDDGLIHELNECVRSAIQGMVDQSLRDDS